MFSFGFKASSLCSFCNSEDETPLHLFFNCHIVKSFWTQLDNYFSHDFRLRTLTPQAALLGMFNDSSINENISLINNRVLKFKLNVYKFS